ncbi:hypothetical protein BJ875DRAFT_547503 [Amylocarpus encephaloides]|uniref:Mid2 domain-containing protein n=1 Tax=Amylocarpus encephaloides TaxID=45428 RepID=A0A9P7Y962_9HELO|nr:hypothetical protein BJ875DRAFT_547503 [Amylocarpus encephaloides]
MLSRVYFALILLLYVSRAEAANIIFASPLAGVILPVGLMFDVNWDITVDSGVLYLEYTRDEKSNSAITKKIAIGISGKTYTWTPTADEVPGSNYLLHIIDEKDNARSGVSDAFALAGGADPKSTSLPEFPEQINIPTSTGNPSPESTLSILTTSISSTDVVPPTSSIPATSISTTNVVPPLSSTQATSKSMNTDGFSTSTRSSIFISLPSTLNTSTATLLKSEPTVTGGSKVGMSSSLPLKPTQTTPPSIPTATASPPATKSPPATIKTGTKIGLAIGAILGVLAILIIGFYFGKKTAEKAKPEKIPENPIGPFDKRGLVRAPSMLKAELDSDAEILEIGGMEKGIAELETNRRERMEFGRVEVADTGRYE